MSDLSRETVLRAVLPVLSEAFAGAADPARTHFVNNAPDCGVFGTLDALSAEQASTPPAPGRPTAAAHAEHLRFSFDVSARWMSGADVSAEWARSWEVQALDEAGWTELRQALRRAYEDFVVGVHQRAPIDEEFLAALVSTVAHAAYHLGALRQAALAVGGAPAAEPEAAAA